MNKVLLYYIVLKPGTHGMTYSLEHRSALTNYLFKSLKCRWAWRNVCSPWNTGVLGIAKRLEYRCAWNSKALGVQVCLEYQSAWTTGVLGKAKRLEYRCAWNSKALGIQVCLE